MRCEGLLLDVYGTVLHDDDDVLAPICARVAFLARETLAAAAEALGSRRAVEEAGSLVERLHSFWRSPPAFADALAFLREVRVPVCLVSNIDTDDLVAALLAHGIEVQAVVTSEDARAYKPRPEPFEMGLRALGLAPQDVLHVGDSLTSDVAGAAALGIRTVWVDRRGRDLPEGARPTHTAAHLGELLSLLEV
ncbi:HAD family hydrolase [Quadrisphaera oryzae]|uniref:HAD family hydrolase n=1 Tax=Quadrisphaera TaxID=317661 RepID=UPI001C987854